MATAKQNSDFLGAIMPQYPLDEAIDWISENLSPEDVFSDKDLEAWAENNDYTKE